MTIVSKGYGVDKNTEDSSKEKELLKENIDLILRHKKDILRCGDYFFCSMPFAFCSWPYVGGDGPLYLGYLLTLWDNQLFEEYCSVCQSPVFIYSMGRFTSIRF